MSFEQYWEGKGARTYAETHEARAREAYRRGVSDVVNFLIDAERKLRTLDLSKEASVLSVYRRKTQENFKLI